MFQLRKSTAIGLLIIAATVCGSSSANAQSVTVRTARILQFQQHRGNYAQENISRLNGMILQLNQNGTFAIAFPNSVFSPMQGRFTVSGNSLILKASKTSRYGNTGFVRGDLVAQINSTSSGPVMTILFASANGNAAVINGTKFSQNTSNAYVAAVLLR